jgi:hypothetical protein
MKKALIVLALLSLIVGCRKKDPVPKVAAEPAGFAK